GTEIPIHTNNITIGTTGTPLNLPDSIAIGNPYPGHLACYLGGVLPAPTSALCVTINPLDGLLGSSLFIPSSKRFKDNITPMNDASNIIYQLDPVQFTYNDYFYDQHEKQCPHEFLFDENGEKRIHYGLIAEEVYKVLPGIIKYDPANNNCVYSIEYERLAPLLLNEAIKANERIKELEKNAMDVEELKQDNQKMAAVIKNL